MTPSLRDRLDAALDGGSAALEELGADHPCANGHDRASTLLTIYALQTGAVDVRSQWAGHPVVAGLRWALERAWMRELADAPLPAKLPVLLAPEDPDLPHSVSAALRWIAARDRLPAVYRWVAEEADAAAVGAFLALEGGPDAGFDDLVAACQTGLSGEAKMELARNYWDEMGNGSLDDVHTTVHAAMATSLSLTALPLAQRSQRGLEREALCPMLAANHWLQPELLGALGLIELQAGPRCRLVGKALRRIGAPLGSLAFYDVHAEVDPRHGRDWLDNAVEPLVRERPEWAPRIVRGAWWRSLVNERFFAEVEADLMPPVAV